MQGFYTWHPTSKWNWMKHKGKKKVRLYYSNCILFLGTVYGLCWWQNFSKHGGVWYPVVLVLILGSSYPRFWFSNSGESLHFNEIPSRLWSWRPMERWISMLFTLVQESPTLEVVVKHSWSYARMNWSLRPIKDFIIIDKQIRCWNLAANTCNYRTMCQACSSAFLYQGHGSGLKVIGCDHLAAKLCLTLSERGGIKARALACLAELNKLQDAAWTAQAFGFGWLAFLLIKAVKD